MAQTLHLGDGGKLEFGTDNTHSMSIVCGADENAITINGSGNVSGIGTLRCGVLTAATGSILQVI